MRVSYSARRSSQSILKKINPEYSLEELMLKLKPPILWPPDAKSWLVGNDLMLRKMEVRRRREQQRMRMVGWHCQFNGHEFEQTLGDSKGEGSLVCCSPWGHKKSDTTVWLN